MIEEVKEMYACLLNVNKFEYPQTVLRIDDQDGAKSMGSEANQVEQSPIR